MLRLLSDENFNEYIVRVFFLARIKLIFDSIKLYIKLDINN
jgi:hypothetical protein